MCCDQILSRETLVLYLNTNRTYIPEAVKVVTGMSFPQYINSIRLEEAVKLINESPQTPIAVIAKKVGLTAPNFRELFKRKYGITPTEYKEKL